MFENRVKPTPWLDMGFDKGATGAAFVAQITLVGAPIVLRKMHVHFKVKESKILILF